MKKKLRPKGCPRTLSGRHLPQSEIVGGSYTAQLKVYCKACGLIDDIGLFHDYLFGKAKKIDDSKL